MERLECLGKAAESSGRLRPLLVIGPRAGNHELTDRGAALTYYAILSLVPGLLILFSLIGFFGDQGTIDEVLSIIEDVGPSSSDTVAKQPLESLLQHEAQSGTLLGIGI